MGSEDCTVSVKVRQNRKSILATPPALNMPQGQCDYRQYRHHAVWHKFFGSGQPDHEKNQQDYEHNVRRHRLKDQVEIAKNQNGGKGRGRVKRHLAFRLEKPHEAAQKKQDNINPQDRFRVLLHNVSGADSGLFRPRLQAQNFARLAFRQNLEWPATNLAVSDELLGRHAGVNDQFESLAAKRALDGCRDLHDNILVGIEQNASQTRQKNVAVRSG
jgi:hypothetical protein